MITNGSGFGVDPQPGNGASGDGQGASPVVVASTVRDERPADPGPLLPPDPEAPAVGWAPTAWKSA
jgi:hypothetical protein